MAKGDKVLEFIKPYAGLKKGHKGVYSRDLSYMLVKEGVAKEYKQSNKATKPKAKAKKK